MKGRVFIILKEDIVYYPPVLSIINILLELKYQIIHIGIYSDIEQKKKLEAKGVIFKPTVFYNKGKRANIVKLYQQLLFRRQVKRYLKKMNASKEDYIWLMQAETICLLNSLIGKHKTILHLFEFVVSNINWKYKIFAPLFSMEKAMKTSGKVVCCEYNRAQITKGMFHLEVLPYILPNKPFTDEDKSNSVPADIVQMVDKIKKQLKGKKVILYQGNFVDKERRLEEFCQAIKEMPDEYVLVAMGNGTSMYETLKTQYECDRIIFVPFIRPPYHLLITQMASIGILSYFARSSQLQYVINPLYCAPNKIFEYARFGIPMLSNDIPGLHYIYLEYQCGECIPYPMTPTSIKDTILKIFDNYESYSQGARNYYNSVDMKYLVSQILN